MDGIAASVVITAAGLGMFGMLSMLSMLSVDDIGKGDEAETVDVGVVQCSVVRSAIITSGLGAMGDIVFMEGCCRRLERCGRRDRRRLMHCVGDDLNGVSIKSLVCDGSG